MRRIPYHLIVLVLTGLALAPSAGAAEVARVDGARLDASDRPRQGGFCVRLSTSRPDSSGNASACGPVPWRPRRSAWVTLVEGDRVAVGGAAPAAVARVEAELADGRRVSVETVPGARYRGRRAGQVRFFLSVLPRTDPRDEDEGGLVALRFFDAAGTLTGAAAEREGRVVGAPQRLLVQRRRGARISVTAVIRRQLAPTPIQLDRFEDVTCIDLRSRVGTSGGETRTCRAAGDGRPPLGVMAEPGCGRMRTVVTGFVGDTVSAVRLRLGSGRVKEVRAKTLAGAEGSEHRYIATVIPRGEAVRRASAVGASATYELGEQPSGLPCSSDSGTRLGTFTGLEPGADGPARPPAGDEQVAAEAGGHRLLVRDAEGDRLCVGVDRLLADGSDCVLPPPFVDVAFALRDGGAVFAVLPAEVARVRLPGGREVPTVAGGYTGRYAGAVRFLLAEADFGVADRIRLLDAAGDTIGRLFVFTPENSRLERPMSRLAAGRGWRLLAGRYAGVPCLGLAFGREAPDCGVAGADTAAISVRCAPRVAVLYGRLARGARPPRVLLRGGRSLRPRVLRLPRRLGHRRAFVLQLPRRAEVVALRVRGERLTFPLLPAARQCGYGIWQTFESNEGFTARAWPGTGRPRGSSFGP
jgi:hypothetical protein